MGEEARNNLEQKLATHMGNAYAKYQIDIREKRDEFQKSYSCLIDECGSVGTAGYPLAGLEEAALHLREIHGADDADLTVPPDHPWHAAVEFTRPDSARTTQTINLGRRRNRDDIDEGWDNRKRVKR